MSSATTLTRANDQAIRRALETPNVGIVATHQRETGESALPRDIIRRAFESAGVEFIVENGGGAGVRLRKRQTNKG
jgi:hypothetical protein